VSPARNQEKDLRELQADSSNHRILVPFAEGECRVTQNEFFLKERFSKYLFHRDLFDMSRPLANKLYFFGRTSFVVEMRDCLKRGENIGLFGLRRTGKTSLLLRLKHLLHQDRSGTIIYVDLEDHALFQLRWWELMYHIAIESGLSRKSACFTEANAASEFRDHIESFQTYQMVECI